MSPLRKQMQDAMELRGMALRTRRSRARKRRRGGLSSLAAPLPSAVM